MGLNSLGQSPTNVGLIPAAPIRKSIHNNVSSNCVGLTSAVVQTYEVNSESKWEDGCSGVACLIKDNLRQAFYIRVFNVNNGTVTLDEEVNSDLGVYFPTRTFMVFVGGTNTVGLQFSSEKKACHFHQHWKLLRKNGQKEAESNVPLKVGSFLKAICKMKNTQINSNTEANSTFYKKKKKNGSWRWKKAGIGPLVRQGGHMESKFDQHSDLRNLDEKQMHILDKYYSCMPQLKEMETTKDVVNLNEKTRDVEPVQHKLQNQTPPPLVKEHTPPLTLTGPKSSRSTALRPPRPNRARLPPPPPPPTFQVSNTVTPPPHSSPPFEPAPTDFHPSAYAALGTWCLPLPETPQTIQNQITKVNQVKNEKCLPPPPPPPPLPPPLPDSSLLSSKVSSEIKRPQLTPITEGHPINIGAGAPPLISKHSPLALIPSRISSGYGSHPPLPMNTLLHPSLIKKNVSLKEDHAISVPPPPSGGHAGLKPCMNRSTLLSQIRGCTQLKKQEKKESGSKPTPTPGALHAHQPPGSGDGLPVKSCLSGSRTEQGAPEKTSCSHRGDIPASSSSRPPARHGPNTVEPPPQTSLQHSNLPTPTVVTEGDNSSRKKWRVFAQNSENICQKTGHPQDKIKPPLPKPKPKPVHTRVFTLYSAASIGHNGPRSFWSKPSLPNQIRQDIELKMGKKQRKSTDAAPTALKDQPPTPQPFRPPNKDGAELKLDSNGVSTTSASDKDRPPVSGGDIQKQHNTSKPTPERCPASPPPVPSLCTIPSKENDCKPSCQRTSVFLTQIREAVLLKENGQQQSNGTSPLNPGRNLDHGPPAATVSIMKSEEDERSSFKHHPTLVNQIKGGFPLKKKEQQERVDTTVTSTSGPQKFDPASSRGISTRSIMVDLMDVIKKRRQVTYSSEEESDFDCDEGW